MKTTLVTTLLLVLSATALAQAAPGKSEDLALTVYNGNYAVVRDLRMLDVADDGRVQLVGVPGLIDPTTVSFKCISSPQARLLEQNYQYDLVNSDSLLRRYIDKTIEIVCEDASYSGKLMSFDSQQIILNTANGIAMIQRPDNVRDIRFTEMPEGLITQPTLMWLLAGVGSGPQKMDISYRTDGVNWHSEYVLVLNEADTQGDLSGWISVNNQSGRSYKNAKLKFIAGDVQRYVAPQVKYRRDGCMDFRELKENQAVSEKSFFEYHMYTLGRRSDLDNRQVKQLEMFAPATGVNTSKRFLYAPMEQFRFYGHRNDGEGYGANLGDKKVGVFVEFKNDEENSLGIPLPAGTVRVFKKDTADNTLQFIGEERIDHTPRKETLSLRIGNAFDLTGGIRRTDYKHRSSPWRIEESYEVTVKNHKTDDDALIRVKLPMFRWSGWKITHTNAPVAYQKLDSHNVAWDIPVAADSEVTFEYTVVYEDSF